jgi:hypothetical protein
MQLSKLLPLQQEFVGVVPVLVLLVMQWSCRYLL